MARKELTALLQGGHTFFTKSIEGLSDEQLLEVPASMNNNLVWNMGHLASSLGGMVYKNCGLDMPVPDSYGELFKGGSSPATWDSAPDPGEVVKVFNDSNAQVCADLDSGKLDSFKPFDLMPGFSMASVEQVLTFHLFHSGMHLNAMGTLRRLIAGG